MFSKLILNKWDLSLCIKYDNLMRICFFISIKIYKKTYWLFQLSYHSQEVATNLINCKVNLQPNLNWPSRKTSLFHFFNDRIEIKTIFAFSEIQIPLSQKLILNSLYQNIPLLCRTNKDHFYLFCAIRLKYS